jgi:hypothetical protein
MRLATRAYRLRQAARQALRAGDFERARDLAAQARDLWAAPTGRCLVAIADFATGLFQSLGS